MDKKIIYVFLTLVALLLLISSFSISGNATWWPFNSFVAARSGGGEVQPIYPRQCTDSDGGKNYYIKGTCTDSSGKQPWSDSVQTSSADGKKKLEEVYCGSNNYCYSELVDCPYGFGDGVCLSPTNGITYQGVLNMLNKCSPRSVILNKDISGNEICGEIKKICLTTYLQPLPTDNTISITYAIQDMKPLECSFVYPKNFGENKNYININILAFCCSP